MEFQKKLFDYIMKLKNKTFNSMLVQKSKQQKNSPTLKSEFIILYPKCSCNIYSKQKILDTNKKFSKKI